MSQVGSGQFDQMKQSEMYRAWTAVAPEPRRLRDIIPGRTHHIIFDAPAPAGIVDHLTLF
jgi:hypothetical protein